MLFLFAITWGVTSEWWVLAGALLGMFYAWLLYRQPTGLSNTLRYLLSAFRFLTVLILSLLLLSPMIKSVTSRQQKPLILVAQDNSTSVKLFTSKGFSPVQFVSQLSGLKRQLGDGYDVREFNFAGDIRDSLSTSFSGKQTDISGVFKALRNRYSDQNIGAIVLASDGIYNKGSSTQNTADNLKTAVYTIALGDTIPKRDLLISNVSYNKTAFLGNDFEVEVMAEAYQSKGEQMAVQIADDGKVVDRRNSLITSNDFHQTITLKVHADKKGVHKFQISLKPLSNEISASNNTETIYIEVLDSKQKILLVYNGPHPDIAAIKQALEVNQNYAVTGSLVNDVKQATLSNYSLVILYQLPAEGTPTALIQDIKKLKLPVMYIAGAQTDLQQLNAVEKLVQINAERPAMQEAFASLKSSFTYFTLSDSTRRILGQLPPLLAPYGTFNTQNGASVLLTQRIGSVETAYPLLVFGEEDGKREAVLTAEGLWRWRINEFALTGNHHAVNELLGQVVQYLTAKDDRRRFRVYAGKDAFDEGEDVLLNAELYNDALELINAPDVKVEVKNKAGKTYSFLFTRTGQTYRLNAGTLPPGEYSYVASTKLGAKALSATNRFEVKALNAETRQSAANHQLLYTLAHQNGGEMLMPNQIDKLADLIRKNENIKTLIYDDKHYSDLIDVKWVFALILVLLSTEWFIRKREGEV
jgi:hypothetical protein